MDYLVRGLLSTCAALASAEIEAPSDLSHVIAGRVPKQETGLESDHLTGDWRGVRSKLVDRGVHLYAGYTGEVLGNVSGGFRRGAIYEGLFEAGVDFDTAKLDLWNGGLLHASSLYPHGSGLSGDYVGDVLTLSNIDAYDSLRLYELWYEQKLFENKFSVRIGQVLADEEFTFLNGEGNFINSAFGWPAFISGNTVNTGPAFYVATPGVRLRFEPGEKWVLQSGVYDGDSFDSPTGNPHVNAHGTHIHLSDKQGVFWISELGYHLHPDKERLSGEYKLGLWLHTGEFPSNFHDRNGDPIIVTGLEPARDSKNYGAYIAGEQTIWRTDDKHEVALFGRLGGSPPDRSLFELVFDGGVTLTGTFPGRDDDQFGAGVAYARLSRDIKRSQRLDALINGVRYDGFSEHETALELFYNARVTKWWTIQPDFQWIFNPGGNTAAPDAVVIGVRSSIAF